MNVYSNIPGQPLSATMALLSDIHAYYGQGRTSQFLPRDMLNPVTQTGDASISESERLAVIERCRMTADRNAVVRFLLDVTVALHLCKPLRYVPETGDNALDEDLWAWHNDWRGDPNRCDAQGELDAHGQTRQVFRAAETDGDVLTLGLRDGSVQVVEGHQCRTPASKTMDPLVVHGFKLDAQRRRRSAYLAHDPVGPFAVVDDGKYSEVDVRDDSGLRQVFVMFHDRRTSRTRAMPPLAPVVEHSAIFDDAQRAAAVMLLLRTQMAWEENVPDGGQPTVYGQSEEEAGPSLEREMLEQQAGMKPRGEKPQRQQIRPGAVIRTKGDKARLHLHAPQLPGDSAVTQLEFMIRIISLSCGIPLMHALLHGSDSNFAGARMVHDTAKMVWTVKQTNIIQRFEVPRYQWLTAWMARQADPRGRALRRAYDRVGADLFKVRFMPNGWPYPQPMHDAAATTEMIANGTASPRQLIAQNQGRDIEDVQDESVRDQTRLILKAMNAADYINTQYPGSAVKVTWRDVVSQAAPRGVTPVLNAPAETAP
jgi:hypothetical protein